MNNCPKCGSNKIRVQYPDISCIACGYDDSLMDFPISHEHHRALCFEYNRSVPTACTATIVPEKGTIIPIKGTEPTAQVDTITQLRGQVRYLDNKLTEHLSKSKKRDRL